MRALLSDEMIADMASGNEDVARLLVHIRTDLDRYLASVHRTPDDPGGQRSAAALG
jgi:hypothetical protein